MLNAEYAESKDTQTLGQILGTELVDPLMLLSNGMLIIFLQDFLDFVALFIAAGGEVLLTPSVAEIIQMLEVRLQNNYC